MRHPTRYGSLEERLLSNCYVNEEGCWIWLGKLSDKGYPFLTMRISGRKSPVNRRAHRLSLLVFKGVDAGKDDVDHRCRVRMCINPEHLQVVTTQENTRLRDVRRKQLTG